MTFLPPLLLTLVVLLLIADPSHTGFMTRHGGQIFSFGYGTGSAADLKAIEQLAGYPVSALLRLS